MFSFMRALIYWQLNEPSSDTPNERNSQIRIMDHVPIGAPTNITAKDHAISVVKHRDAAQELLKDSVSSKHVDHEFCNAHSADKCLYELYADQVFRIALADEVFLMGEPYIIYAAVAHEVGLLESSAVAKTHDDDYIIEFWGLGDPEQVSHIDFRWKGTEPTPTTMTQEDKDVEDDIIAFEEAFLYKTKSQSAASTNASVRQVNLMNIPDDERRFLGDEYKNVPVPSGMHFRRFDEDMYLRYLSKVKVYTDRRKYKFVHPGNKIIKLNVLDRMMLADWNDADLSLLASFFVCADTQKTLRECKPGKTVFGGRGTMHTVRGTSKVRLICFTSLNVAMTQRKPPPCKWRDSSLRSDRRCHTYSGWMRIGDE